MNERAALQKPAEQYCKSLGLKYIKKNWNNHKRQGDEGAPDLIIFLSNGRTLFIEFKTSEKYKLPNHNRSIKQLEWAEYLTRHNHIYYCIENLEKFKKKLETLLKK